MEKFFLSPQERLHIERGGHVLMVEEIDGARWQVLSISLAETEIVPAKPGSAAHELHRDAQRAAVAAASKLGDKALVRPSRYSYEVEFHVADRGGAWRLRMQKDSRDVEEKLFHMPRNTDDEEEAFYGTHDLALSAGEHWVAAQRRY
ncbi:hypothetical protein [Azohydromonas lata]|uniref:hypothetical protein n=1 Tax=Azohydromonas lata TaxID=45677 RepID=UPI00082DB026|nr:hypothetical protein [Azohydromonas lata]